MLRGGASGWRALLRRETFSTVVRKKGCEARLTAAARADHWPQLATDRTHLAALVVEVFTE